MWQESDINAVVVFKYGVIRKIFAQSGSTIENIINP